MNSIGLKKFVIWIASATCLLSCTSAFATTRTVYFDQTAVASSVNGFAADQTGKCRIVVSNPSTADQTVSITIYLSSISNPTLASMDGNGVLTNALGNPSNPSASPSTGYFTGTGAAGAAYVMTNQSLVQGSSSPMAFEFAYKPFAANTAATEQTLNCRGQIDVNDSGTSPGFVVANGAIVTFTESSVAQTQGATSASTAFGGTAIYSQVPISINRGKPF